jgi:hypothetical protein
MFGHSLNFNVNFILSSPIRVLLKTSVAFVKYSLGSRIAGEKCVNSSVFTLPLFAIVAASLKSYVYFYCFSISSSST